MTTTLVLTQDTAEHLMTLGAMDVEAGAVMLVRPYRSGDTLRLLVAKLVDVPAAAYVKREHDELKVSSQGFVPPLAHAAESDLVPIWVHTHVGANAIPVPSRRDDRVDELLEPLFTSRTDSDLYGSAIFSIDEAGQLAFTGRLRIDSHQSQIDRLVVVGRGIRVVTPADRPAAAIPAMFDRHVRAFGGGIQQVLSQLRIAVVGCGGTGSNVAEQVVRLGVRDLILVDPDVIEPTNVTRVYGSTPKDVGSPKVEVLADHLVAIQPELEVERAQAMLTSEAAARRVATADVIFGCTDDNAGRMILSRLSSFMLQPAIDCGVVITSDAEQTMTGVYGRVTTMRPGAACLICRGRVDLQRAASEALTPNERRRLADEGYVPALDEVNPAVVTYTTAVAAAAVGELINLLLGGVPDSDASEIVMRLHEREVSANAASPNDGHYCDPRAGQLGQGGGDPFLDVTWRG